MDKLKTLEPLVEAIKTPQRQKTPKLLGKLYRKVDGGKIFELNLQSRTITEVKLEVSDTFKINGVNKEKLIRKPDCLYTEALNIANAKKRFLKGKYF
jgi:hypothetical protein